MLLTLAAASLTRHRNRTALAVLGVAVAAAMLLDMVMLSSGMRESFKTLLLSRGFQLRVAPKGTLPFDTEATIADASAVAAALRERPELETVSPVLGRTLHVRVTREAGQPVASFVLGTDPAVQGDYQLLDGADVSGDRSAVVNDDFVRATGAKVGDTVWVATGYDAQLRVERGRRPVVIAGRARFLYLSARQPAMAMRLAALQAMLGDAGRDRVSLMMVRARGGADIEDIRQWIDARVPTVTAISIATALAQVDERLSYFRQLAFILGAVSLVVGFLLVTTLMTVSVNERVGEIAAMRAIGVARGNVVRQIVLEGAAIAAAGGGLGLLLGLGTARYLNGILSGFPGLPVAIDFFLFQPRDAWTALALLMLAAAAAGAYPGWRAASLPVAESLREEGR